MFTISCKLNDLNLALNVLFQSAISFFSFYIFSFPFHFSFLSQFQNISGGAQGLLLSLGSGIISGGAREDMCGVEDQTWVNCIQGKYPNFCTISLQSIAVISYPFLKLMNKSYSSQNVITWSCYSQHFIFSLTFYQHQ